MLLFLFYITIITAGGQDQNTSEISDGTTAKLGEFPYQVSLQKIASSLKYSYENLTHFCGGTIISKKHVLTAAHCFNDYKQYKNKTNYYAILGLVYLGDKNGIVRSVTDIYLHRNIERRGNDIPYHDIAILVVNRFNYNRYVRRVKFGNIYISQSTTCYLTGWSKISPQIIRHTKHLKLTKQIVQSTHICKRQFPYQFDSLSQFCAGGIEDQNSCFGDSGSPLVCDGIQYGIVTFGPKVCGLGMTTFYTNVSYFNKWIKSFTVPNKANRINPVYTTQFYFILLFTQF